MIKIRKRYSLSRFDVIKVSVFSIILSFLAFAIILWQSGVDPIGGYAAMFAYAFDTVYGLELTFSRMTFFILVTLAFILPLKAGIWNIGGPGQVYMGMIAGVGISYVGWDLPSGILIPLMIIGSAVSAGGLAAIAGYLKGKLNVSEVVVTIMLNSVMLYLVKYLIEGPWKTPTGEAQSAVIPAPGRFPMIGETTVAFTIFLAIGLCILFYFVYIKTRIGFELKTYGSNPIAARNAGMSFTKIAVITMFFGGAMAGIAGIHQTAGISGVYRIGTTFADSAGMWSFYGIVYGLMCALNPLAAIVPAFFFSGIQVGCQAFETRLGMSYGANLAFIGILMIVLVAGQVLYRVRIVWKAEKLDEGVKE